MTITSSTPGHMLDKLRRWSGPNPEGSKLTDVERLHLISMLGALGARELSDEGQAWTAQLVRDQLAERGMSEAELHRLLLGIKDAASAVALADLIAVHPSLKSLADTYLD